MGDELEKDMPTFGERRGAGERGQRGTRKPSEKLRGKRKKESVIFF